MPDALGHLLLSLPALIDEAREAGLPVVLKRTKPLPEHAQRLMDALGVEVRLMSIAEAADSRDCTFPHCDREAGSHSDLCGYHATIRRDAPMDCKIEGCENDASDAPKAGPTSRLCAVHRAEKSAEMSAARTGRAHARSAGERSTPAQHERQRAAAPARNGNGSYTSKAERVLAAARAVDEIEAQLAKARDELNQAAAALS